MKQRDLAALVGHPRMTPDAVRATLHYVFKGPGAHPYDADELSELLEEGGPKRVAKALRRAERVGYLIRKVGGRGHTDLFEWTLTPAALDDVSDRPAAADGLNADRPASSDDVNGTDGAPHARGSLSGVSNETPTTPTHQASSQPPREEADGGRAGAIEEMTRDVGTWAGTHLPDQAKREAFLSNAGWLIAEDATAWEDVTGTRIDWPLRPALLRGALARLAAGESWKLRPAVRYVIKQQTDPIRGLTSEDFPKPVVAPFAVGGGHREPPSPPPRPDASAVVRSWERAPEEREAVARQAAAEQAQVAAWEQDHPEDAARIRAEIEREHRDATERFRDRQYRERVLDLLQPSTTSAA